MFTATSTLDYRPIFGRRMATPRDAAPPASGRAGVDAMTAGMRTRILATPAPPRLPLARLLPLGLLLSR